MITLRKSLVHPKDKHETTETTGCVYELSCKNCDHTNVGETGWYIVSHAGQRAPQRGRKHHW